MTDPRIANLFLPWNQYPIGVDLSKYQKIVDYSTFRDAGHSFLIARCSYGYTIDNMFATHCQGAYDNDLLFLAYHWLDPMLHPPTQLKVIAKALENKAYWGLAIDIEQYWASWDEYFIGDIKIIIPPANISDRARWLVEEAHSLFKKPIIVYTRDSFIRSWSPQMSIWAKQHPLWLAQYPYPKRPIIHLESWADLLTNHMPADDVKVAIPKECGNWHFWQFTGDKFVIDGVYSWRVGKYSALDINLFNGSENDLFDMFQYEPITPRSFISGPDPQELPLNKTPAPSVAPPMNIPDPANEAHVLPSTPIDTPPLAKRPVVLHGNGEGGRGSGLEEETPVITPQLESTPDAPLTLPEKQTLGGATAPQKQPPEALQTPTAETNTPPSADQSGQKPPQSGTLPTAEISNTLFSMIKFKLSLFFKRLLEYLQYLISTFEDM